MGLGEKDGEEFDQVKVALVPVVEPHVPNEFGLGGHVVVRDHAAVPPRAELHADKSPYEMVRGRGGGADNGYHPHVHLNVVSFMYCITRTDVCLKVCVCNK